MVGGCRPAHQRPSNKLIFYKDMENNPEMAQDAVAEAVLAEAMLDAAPAQKVPRNSSYVGAVAKRVVD
jgi:hypothetical protein